MNMMFARTMAAALLSVTLAGPVLAVPDDRAMAPSGRDQQSLYWQGHEQLKAGRWNEAVDSFTRLEEELRRSEPASADAALYWRAYAQSKAKRTGEARATLERLRREFPKSRWMAEVGRLQEELGQAPRDVEGGESALVDAAIEGLLSAPPERALPLLKRVVEGNYEMRSKKRALFVLSQLDDPQASALVLQVARGSDTTLSREAITMLGIGGDPASLKALQDIYRDTRERDVRKAVLGAYMVASDKEGLLAVARDSSDSELQREAIHLLGASGAGEELTALMRSENDTAALDAIVDALGISGNAKVLGELARNGGRPTQLRKKALQSLGIAGDSKGLGVLYRELKAPELKQAALEGLMISGSGDVLRELYREASSDDEKRDLLKMMTVLGDDAAIDAIEAAIQQGEGK